MCKSFDIKYLFMIFIVLVFSLPSLMNSQTWKKVEDDNIFGTVHKIFFPKEDSNMLVIASDNVPMNIVQKEIAFYDNYPQINGKGFQISYDRGETFTEIMLDGFFVYEIAQDPNNDSLWLASVRNDGYGSIFVSTDNGKNWDTEDMRVKGSSQILKIASKASMPTRYLSSSINTIEGFKTSEDAFENYTTNTNLYISSRDIAISPIDTNLIFLAGDNLHQGGVFRSYDNGETWQKDVSGLENLRIHCVMPSSNNSSIVVCGADSLTMSGSVGKGIFVSLDTGKTWNLAGAKGSRVFQLAVHPKNPRFMAAACDSSGVWVSGSWGTGWEQFAEGFTDTSSVRTVGIPSWSDTEDGIIVFAGLFGEGLYKSENIKTAVKTNDNKLIGNIEVISLAPMPFNEKLNITWSTTIARKYNIAINDVNGNTVAQFDDKLYEKGVHSFIWFPNNDLPSGTYFLVISSALETISEKCIYKK